MFKRHNKGWLQLNDMPMQHFWYRAMNPAAYHSLCGITTAPQKIDAHSKAPCCPTCEAMRQMETEAQSKRSSRVELWA